jgi:hypothetical protein
MGLSNSRKALEIQHIETITQRVYSHFNQQESSPEKISYISEQDKK